MITSLRMRNLGVILWMAASACSDSTPIGTVECLGERIRCGPTENQRDPDASVVEPPRDEVSSTAVDTLTPSWSGRPFADDSALSLTLVADPEGNLWSTSIRDDRVQLAKLDREGVTVEERKIEPPKSVRDPSGLRANDVQVSPASTHSRATVGISWTRDCDGGSGEDCYLTELLVFEDFAKTPRRVVTGGDYAPAQASRSGIWLVNNTVPSVEKIDNSANLIWRQTGLVHFNWYATLWQARSALRTETELSVLVWDDNTPIFGFDLWKLDASGSIETHQRVGWVGGESPQYALDPLGRDVITGATIDGDLAIMRLLPNGTSEGNLIVREEYLGLSADALAIDAEGTAYVTTHAGGREPSQRRELLCRLRSVGAAECFTLGEVATTEQVPLIDQFVVPEPGVVYVRSGSDLRRYDLPGQ